MIKISLFPLLEADNLGTENVIMSFIKGILNPKINVQPSFAYPCVFLNPYDGVSFVKCCCSNLPCYWWRHSDGIWCH